MLFAYTYVPHSLEKLQKYIDFLFLKVWCNAYGDFDLTTLDGCPDLRDIVIDIANNDRITIEYLPIEDIYDAFRGLSKKTRKKLKRWYLMNNAIEHLCNNNTLYSPLKYSDLNNINTDLRAKLEVFFKRLYSKEFLSLEAIKSRVGGLDDHFVQFVEVNNNGKCPFCGLHDLKGKHHSRREPYDHYLPKDIYPFNSINFKNLVPMCSECNSTYKLRRDPLYDGKNKRRRSFFAFSLDDPIFDIEVSLTNADIDNLKPDQIQIIFKSGVHQEEVRTWTEIFNIEERYAAKLLSPSSKFWFTQILDEFRWYKVSPSIALQRVLSLSNNSPYEEVNFLKGPFLEACERHNLFVI